MDIEKLKAEHPAVYAAAVADGVAKEQKRVSAHLSSGETCGDMSIATKAISEGKAYGDADVSAAYFNANMKKSHIDANLADDADLSAAANGGEAPAPKPELTTEAKNIEAALAGVEENMGITDGGRDFLYQGAK